MSRQLAVQMAFRKTRLRCARATFAVAQASEKLMQIMKKMSTRVAHALYFESVEQQIFRFSQDMKCPKIVSVDLKLFCFSEAQLYLFEIIWFNLFIFDANNDSLDKYFKVF